MPRVSEQYTEARRQEILNAAFVCFARQGFHQTTMDDICREGGVSPGAVYRYFSSKEEIIEASCEGCYSTDMSEVEAALKLGDTQQVLNELARLTFADLTLPNSHVRLAVQVLWWSEAMRSPEMLESLRAQSVDSWKSLLAGVIARAQEQGEVNSELDPEAAARVLLATWQGLVLQKALDPEVDVEGYVDAVRAMYGGTFWRVAGPPGDGSTELRRHQAQS